MNQEIQKDLSVIQCIRISLNMSQLEFCRLFGCSLLDLMSLENHQINIISLEDFQKGLEQLSIPYEEYQKLEDYLEHLKTQEINHQKQFQLLLLKVVSMMVRLENKKEIDQRNNLVNSMEEERLLEQSTEFWSENGNSRNYIKLKRIEQK